jgi:hypothetical protein
VIGLSLAPLDETTRRQFNVDAPCAACCHLGRPVSDAGQRGLRKAT